MKLNPDKFLCYEHADIDLTELVREQLSHAKMPVVGYSVASPSKSDTAKDRPFIVIVSCSGHGTAHDVECDGTYSDG